MVNTALNLTAIKPTDFFGRLSLTELDTTSADYIRENLLNYDNLDLLQGTDALAPLIDMLSEHFPKSLVNMPEVKAEEPEPEPEPKPQPERKTKQYYKDRIAAYKLLLSTAPKEKKKDYKDKIAGYKLFLETAPDLMAEGGMINQVYWELDKDWAAIKDAILNESYTYINFNKDGRQYLFMPKKNGKKHNEELVESKEKFFKEAPLAFATGGSVSKKYHITYSDADNKLEIEDIYAGSTSEARDEFSNKHPNCKIKSIIQAFEDGGTIPNNYAGKTPEQVWNEWDIDQKTHFLEDHRQEISELNNPNEIFASAIVRLNKLSYSELSGDIKSAIELHIREGQYAKGGKIPEITIIESDGEEDGDYPVDESQTVSNAGDAIVYKYKGKYYEIITWNDRAEEHKNGEKTIRELALDEYREDEFKEGGSIKSHCPVGTEVQALVFDKNNFTKAQALAWSRKHFGKGPWADVGKNYYRVRLQSPKLFKKNSFRLSDFGGKLPKGVRANVACPKHKK